MRQSYELHLVQAYKRSAHGDGSVIYDIVVAVGFSFACTVSEIGFCASGRSGFQKGYRTIWLNLFRLWLQYEICYFPFVECLVSYGSAFKLNKAEKQNIYRKQT